MFAPQTANGGGAESKWVGQRVSPPIGHPYAAMSFTNTSSFLNVCLEMCLPSASRSLANRRDSSVVGSAWGVQSNCLLLTVVPPLPELLGAPADGKGQQFFCQGLRHCWKKFQLLCLFQKKLQGLAPLCASLEFFSCKPSFTSPKLGVVLPPEIMMSAPSLLETFSSKTVGGRRPVITEGLLRAGEGTLRFSRGHASTGVGELMAWLRPVFTSQDFAGTIASGLSDVDVTRPKL